MNKVRKGILDIGNSLIKRNVGVIDLEVMMSLVWVVLWDNEVNLVGILILKN